MFPYNGRSLSNVKVPLGSVIFCTIIAKNYFSAARTLMQSVRAYHHEAVLITLIVDEIDEYIVLKNEDFHTIFASDLDIPRWFHFSFKYDLLELSTAIKPYFISVLFKEFGAKKIIYLDPDIVVYQPLDLILSILDSYTVVLTPHITTPLKADDYLRETDFLRLGTFNLGFFAISQIGQWKELLDWWQDKLYTQCTREQERGIFVDQRWIDLVPSLFEGIYILRNPGYNVAWWNLRTRGLKIESSVYKVNGDPLTFFHFSGFMFDRPEHVTRHLSHLRLIDLHEDLQILFRQYYEYLNYFDYQNYNNLPYSYNTFEDGSPISHVIRFCLRRVDPYGIYWPNPYDVSSSSNFRSWATKPDKYPLVSDYMLTLYQYHAELQQAFPNIPGTDGESFAKWFIQQIGISETFHHVYVNPIINALDMQGIRDISSNNIKSNMSMDIELDDIPITDRCICGRVKPDAFF